MDLSELTTLRVGGPARELVLAESADAIVHAALGVWATGEDWLALGGGSNMVVSDDGFDGTVIRIGSHGITALPSAAGTVRLRVEAGEPWDDLVAHSVRQGLGGLEALSGIPGSTGAAPMQNIGAYGQEIADTLVAVEFLDHETGQLVRLPAAELSLAYRSSVFKDGRAGIVTALEMDFDDADGLSRPVAYDQLAAALGVAVGERAPVAEVRAAVLALRASKGMVLDPADPDTTSAGSFFTNPLVTAGFARSLPEAAPRWETDSGEVKVSAAWLIERAGIRRGFRLPGSGAAISSKHTLALTNTGGATASDITELARLVQERVRNEFGIYLRPEPVYVGFGA
ncbi:MAG: UDP-N-acetylmuramate dehydrogenase [Burkholderiaceae bacterium]|nr:UDP-N-acetylmuramate dehydrogenase [Microbacteriaceae bacterium]